MDEPRCGLPDPCLCTGREGCLTLDDETDCPGCGNSLCDGDCEDDSYGVRPMVTEWALTEAGLL